MLTFVLVFVLGAAAGAALWAWNGQREKKNPNRDRKVLTPDHGFNSERSQRAENGGRP